MKKKILKHFIGTVIALLSWSALWGQESRTATVVAEFQYGSQNIYFLHDPIKSHYYKSVLTDVDLNVQNNVTIWFPANKDSLYKVDALGVQPFYAKRIINYNNQQLPQEISLMLPHAENDILFFDNKEHLAELLELTENFVSRYQDDDSLQNYLNKIESLFGDGFLSYRSYFNDKYPSDNSYTDKEIDQMYQENFISDDILNTYFNQFRLMGIGDSVYYYNTRKEILSVNRKNTKGIDYLRRLARYKDNFVDFTVSNEISGIELELEGVDYLSKDGTIGSHKGGAVMVNSGGTDIIYQTIPNKFDQVENCNPFKKALKIDVKYGEVAASSTSYLSYYSSNDVQRTVTLIVNWGDGSPLETVNNYSGDFVYHSYPSNASQASYNVIVETRLVELALGNEISIFDGENNGVVYFMSSPIKFPISVACTDQDVQVWSAKVVNNWMMKSSAWVNNNIFGGVIGGYTHAYVKQNNGNWKLEKAQIRVEVDGVFRHKHNCDNTEHKSGNKEHGKDKKIQLTKTKLFVGYRQFGNGDVKTKHRLIKGNILIQDQITLNPC